MPSPFAGAHKQAVRHPRSSRPTPAPAAGPSHPRRARSRGAQAPGPPRTPPSDSGCCLPRAGLKASSAASLEAIQRRRRGQRSLAQRLRASAAATRSRPASAASRPRQEPLQSAVSELGQRGAQASCPRRGPASRPSAPAGFLARPTGSRTPESPLKTDPAAPPGSGAPADRTLGPSLCAGSPNLAPPAPSSWRF